MKDLKLTFADPGQHDTNDLVQAIREFIRDARFIIEKVDEFNLSMKLARHYPKDAPIEKQTIGYKQSAGEGN